MNRLNQTGALPLADAMHERHGLRLTLIDDVVLTRRSATVGQHECLDHVPGATLRGWVAARLYRTLSAEEAWTVFHSGAVRFGNGLPGSAAGGRCGPVPLAWHVDKATLSAPGHDGGQWLGEQITNLAVGERVPGTQLRQLRSGHVAPDGQRCAVRQRYRMMTAIGEDGRAADGQLFGYESLCAGQQLFAWVSFAPQVAPPLRRQVLQTLDGVLRLGRSRATQYGRVRSEVQQAPWPEMSAQPVQPVGEVLRLWLWSDACLMTADGLPTFEPDGELLGLPGARLLPQRCFVRTRSYSPWNAHRATHETERHVLCAGSVLTLTRAQGFDVGDLQRLQQEGIGLHRAEGLGEVCVQPLVLQDAQPRFAAPVASPRPRPAEPARPVAPRTPLVGYVQSRLQQHQRPRLGHAWAREQLQALMDLLAGVRRFNGWPAAAPCGPAAAQWGALADAVQGCDSLKALRARVLDGQGALCKPTDPVWKLDCPGTGGQVNTLRGWVTQALDSLAGPNWDWSAASYAWQWTCAEARRLDLARDAATLQRARQRVNMEGEVA